MQDHELNPLVHAVNNLADAIRSSTRAITKTDLEQMEARLTDAIKSIQTVDTSGLAALLERSKGEAATLASFATPPAQP
jgi:hypothetical protein